MKKLRKSACSDNLQIFKTIFGIYCKFLTYRKPYIFVLVKRANISRENIQSLGQVQMQVNLCQKLSFLNQLTHNMMTDCSLNYKFRTCCIQILFRMSKQKQEINFCTQHVLNLCFACFYEKIHTVSKYSFLITKQLTSLYVAKAFRTLPFAYKGLEKTF